MAEVATGFGGEFGRETNIKQLEIEDELQSALDLALALTASVADQVQLVSAITPTKQPLTEGSLNFSPSELQTLSPAAVKMAHSNARRAAKAVTQGNANDTDSGEDEECIRRMDQFLEDQEKDEALAAEAK